MIKIKRYETQMKINRIVDFTGRQKELGEPYGADNTARCFWCHEQMPMFKHIVHDKGLAYGNCETCNKCTLVVFTFRHHQEWYKDFLKRREYAQFVTVYKCDAFPEHLKTINSIHAMAEMQKDEA